MKVTINVVIDGEATEVFHFEREDLQAGNLGMAMAEAKFSQVLSNER